MSNDPNSLFRAATELRDQDRLPEAKDTLVACLKVIGEGEYGLMSAAYSQLAHIEDTLADRAPDQDTRIEHLARVADYAARAVKANGVAELPSLQLFIVLSELGRLKEAYEEAIRYLSLRASAEYQSMLGQRHAEERDPEIAELANTVRRLLASPPGDHAE